MRRIGEAVGAGRQQAGQCAGPEQVAGFSAVVLEAEQNLRDLSVCGGQRQACARLGGKAVGFRELPLSRGKPDRIASQVALVANVMGTAGASDLVSNTECISVPNFTS